MNDATFAATFGQEKEENVVGRRIVAALIDMLFLAMIGFFLALLTGGVNSDNGFKVELTGGPFLVYLALVVVYYLLFEVPFKTTPGKIVMSLRVVAADGSDAGPIRIVVRNVLRLVDWLPFLYVVGLVSMAISKRRRRLGDLVSGTQVVRV